MTVIACPHGCGGIVNTAKSPWCESCRRGIHETEIVIAESAEIENPAQRKLSYCWQWWGPSHHRMRCRLPKDHEGPHDTHEERDENSMIVTCDGEWIKP